MTFSAGFCSISGVSSEGSAYFCTISKNACTLPSCSSASEAAVRRASVRRFGLTCSCSQLPDGWPDTRSSERRWIRVSSSRLQLTPQSAQNIRPENEKTSPVRAGRRCACTFCTIAYVPASMMDIWVFSYVTRFSGGLSTFFFCKADRHSASSLSHGRIPPFPEKRAG